MIRHNFPQVYNATKYLVSKLLRCALCKQAGSSLRVSATFGKIYIAAPDQQTFVSVLSQNLSDRIADHLQAMETWITKDRWDFVRELYYDVDGKTVCTRTVQKDGQGSPEISHTVGRQLIESSMRYTHCLSKHHEQSVCFTGTPPEVRQDNFGHYLTRVCVESVEEVDEVSLQNLLVRPRRVRVSTRRLFTLRSRAIPSVVWLFKLVYSWEGNDLQQAFQNMEKNPARISFCCEASQQPGTAYSEAHLTLLLSSLLLKMKDLITAAPSREELQTTQSYKVPVFYPTA